MCNHKYKTNYALNSVPEYCEIADLFDLWNKNNLTNQIDLPIDSNGNCIFHSMDINWKRENNFHAQFLHLEKIYSKYRDKYDRNYREFIFIGRKTEHWLKSVSTLKENPRVIDEEVYVIDCINFSGDNIFFSNSIFENGLIIKNKEIKSFLDFENCSFKSDVLITDVTFKHNITFSKAIFQKRISFEECTFNDFIDFCNTRIFDDFNLGQNYFHSQALFSYMKIERENGICYVSSTFKDFTDFSNGRFNSSFSFEEAIFEGETRFSNTEFYQQTFFNDITVKNILSFGGKNSSNKIFYDHVEFKIQENNIKGKIIFENLNFSNILKKDRENLIELSYKGKVEIGSGCIKYRHQTSKKEILIDENNQSLITEMCQTFVNFFIVHNGLNLGIEIIKRTERHISFFYFSDENISKDEFSHRLKDTEQNLLELLTVNSQAVLNETNDKVALKAKNENVLINTIDGISALVNTFFRVGIRISTGRWKSSDTQALLYAIGFGGNNFLEYSNLHNTIEKNYKGKELVEIFQKQNITIINNNTVNQFGDKSVYVEENKGNINQE